jgi:hypothetical protein
MFIKMTHILAFMILITPLQLTPFWRRGPSKEDRLLALEKKLIQWKAANDFSKEFMKKAFFEFQPQEAPTPDWSFKLDKRIQKLKQKVSTIYSALEPKR